MKQLELQQEREERELERGIAPSDSAAATDSASATAAIRSRSGNDLAFNGGEGEQRKRSDYANAKSMPGSRRHSGEIVVEGADGERRVKGRDGEAPMMNSFLFDDELEADLQSELHYQYYGSRRLE